MCPTIRHDHDCNQPYSAVTVTNGLVITDGSLIWSWFFSGYSNWTQEHYLWWRQPSWYTMDPSDSQLKSRLPGQGQKLGSSVDWNSLIHLLWGGIVMSVAMTSWGEGGLCTDLSRKVVCDKASAMVFLWPSMYRISQLNCDMNSDHQHWCRDRSFWVIKFSKVWWSV